MNRSWLVVAVIAGVIAVYVLRLDDIAGLYKDDAYYLVLAQALARGEGYTLISSATGPVLPAFPPGYPLLLAPVFLVAPSFPANLIWLKAVSIIAMIGTGFFTHWYWHRRLDEWRSAAIAVLTMLLPGFVFLATSTTMSECVFTCAMMASAVAIERAAREDDGLRRRRSIIVAALLTTAAWLIRSMGLALVPGGALFLFWKRGWRAAGAFLLVCAISYAPWSAYTRAHAPTIAEREAHGGDVVRGFSDPAAAFSSDPLRRWSASIVNVFGRSVGAMIFPVGYRGGDESGLEVFNLTGAMELRAGSMGIGGAPVAMSCVVACFVLVGVGVMARRHFGVAELFCALTIGLVVVATSQAVYRYVLPLAPFVLGYFLIGVESVAARVRQGSGSPAFRIAAAIMLAFLLVDHTQYVWCKAYGPPPLFVRDGMEVRLVTDYVGANLPADAKIASTNPGLVYMLTGRKAVAYGDVARNRERWEAAGIQYAVALHNVPQPSKSARGQTLYESPRLKLWVTEIGPPVGTDKN